MQKVHSPDMECLSRKLLQSVPTQVELAAFLSLNDKHAHFTENSDYMETFYLVISKEFT